MADPIRASAKRLLQQLKLWREDPCAGLSLEQAESELRAALAAEPPAPDPREALAARPLLEAVARMGDRIGQHTVSEITVISDRAAAWLAENPPGQPVAIEPRGCPAPGACSCVEPPAPDPEPSDFQTFQGIALDMIESLQPIVIPEILGVLRKAIRQPPAPVPIAMEDRLPQAEDCRFNVGAVVGSCWCWNAPTYAGSSGWWSLEPLEFAEDASHWLPHWAIPQPPQGEEVA